MLLYYITDRKGFAGTDLQQRRALLQKIAEAARAAVDYIQLREKDLLSRNLELLARDAVRAVQENSSITKLLVNGRVDIAIACGADGVHMPAGELHATEVRALWRKCSDREPLIGVSAHSTAEVREAETDGADFTVLAPIFEKVQTAGKGIGLEALRFAAERSQAAMNVAVPHQGNFAILALGGVTLNNARACLQAGAAGVAGIRIFQNGDTGDTVLRLRELGDSLR
ncbi:MAG: thiamine phosphate synthase [Candidatus Korobacteraceae bacterium]